MASVDHSASMSGFQEIVDKFKKIGSCFPVAIRIPLASESHQYVLFRFRQRFPVSG